MSIPIQDEMIGHSIYADRYLEKDGRAYRWDEKTLYLILGNGNEVCIDVASEAEHILRSGVDISKNRALRIVAIVPAEPGEYRPGVT